MGYFRRKSSDFRRPTSVQLTLKAGDRVRIEVVGDALEFVLLEAAPLVPVEVNEESLGA